MRKLFFTALLLSLSPPTVSAGSVAEFWQGCEPKLTSKSVDGFYRVRSIGGTPKTTDVITKLILKGDKIGTFTSPWVFQGDRSITPEIGAYSVLTDAENTPRAVLQTTELLTLPFNRITERETAIDGPMVRPIEIWKPIHVTFFSNELEKIGKTFVEDMPITVEKFKVVCDG
ncbi:MAG: ASCH domain-containing protein [Rhodospirillaceae bacterium]|nr:ASCH domain-containing protein [Rhodospirillaceae bacterium]